MFDEYRIGKIDDGAWAKITFRGTELTSIVCSTYRNCGWRDDGCRIQLQDEVIFGFEPFLWNFPVLRQISFSICPLTISDQGVILINHVIRIAPFDDPPPIKEQRRVQRFLTASVSCPTYKIVFPATCISRIFRKHRCWKIASPTASASSTIRISAFTFTATGNASRHAHAGRISTERLVNKITQFREPDNFIKFCIDLLFGESHNRTIHINIISAGKFRMEARTQFKYCRYFPVNLK